MGVVWYRIALFLIILFKLSYSNIKYIYITIYIYIYILRYIYIYIIYVYTLDASSTPVFLLSIWIYSEFSDVLDIIPDDPDPVRSVSMSGGKNDTKEPWWTLYI